MTSGEEPALSLEPDEIRDLAVGQVLTRLREQAGFKTRPAFRDALHDDLRAPGGAIDGQNKLSLSMLTQVELGDRSAPEWLVQAIARHLQIDPAAITLAVDDLQRSIGKSVSQIELSEVDLTEPERQRKLREQARGRLATELEKLSPVKKSDMARGLHIYRDNRSIQVQSLARAYMGVMLRIDLSNRVEKMSGLDTAKGKLKDWVDDEDSRPNQVLRQLATATPILAGEPSADPPVPGWDPYNDADQVIRQRLEAEVANWDSTSVIILMAQTWLADPFAPHDPFGPDKGKVMSGKSLYRKALDSARTSIVEVLLTPGVLEDMKNKRPELKGQSQDRIAVLVSKKMVEWTDKATESLKRPSGTSLPIYVLAGGAVGALIVMSGGLLAAPAIAGAIGAGAGLSGAAAVSSGLAALGGGALAAGGTGVVGGMVVVGATGAALGASAGSALGGAVWHSGQSAQLRNEQLFTWLTADLADYALPGPKAAHLLSVMLEGVTRTGDQLERDRASLEPTDHPDSDTMTSLDASLTQARNLAAHIESVSASE